MPRGPYYDPGRYWGKITNQQLGTSSRGNPQFVLSFEVIGKINPADPEGELLAVGQNYERTIYRSITDKSIDWILEDLEKLGFTGASFAELDLNAEVHQDFCGQEIPVRCDHDKYEGAVREKWSIGSGSSGVTIAPLEPKALRQLDSIFGKALRAATKTAKTAKTQQATAPQPPPEPSGDPGADVPQEPEPAHKPPVDTEAANRTLNRTLAEEAEKAGPDNIPF